MQSLFETWTKNEMESNINVISINSHNLFASPKIRAKKHLIWWLCDLLVIFLAIESHMSSNS